MKLLLAMFHLNDYTELVSQTSKFEPRIRALYNSIALKTRELLFEWPHAPTLETKAKCSFMK